MTDDAGGKRGPDAPVAVKKDDLLNRWPFAREIYGIATTGPNDWSVRIGVYGEWGSGKTSVLKFVEQMAKAEKHLFLTFNPWQFNSIDRLCKGLAKAIFSEIRRSIPNTETNIKQWEESIGDAEVDGLTYLRNLFKTGASNLASIRDHLENHRIIIAIDDLDRTSPNLVPEMLFALKEIMDVPGMAFVCAFDPNVVGMVLGHFHPGFGNGLNFLEKIIDYPRWLPTPEVDQFRRLALAEAKKYCDFLPTKALKEAVALLPQNPRSIRQFVRVLALLRPQIERHYEGEIQWSIVLAANIIKVRFPQWAENLLGNEGFWDAIYASSIDETEPKREQVIEDEIAKLKMIGGKDFPCLSKKELARCLVSISAGLSNWFGPQKDGLMKQFYLAEHPSAVTWKEFDRFTDEFQVSKRDRASIQNWIAGQADAVNQSEEVIFDFLLVAAIEARGKALSGASNAIDLCEEEENYHRASMLLDVLKILFLEMGEVDEEDTKITASHLKRIFDTVGRNFKYRSCRFHEEGHASEAELLTRIVEKWSPNVLPIIDVIGFSHDSMEYEYFGEDWLALIHKLRSTVKEKLADWLITEFSSDANFVEKMRSGKQPFSKKLFLDIESSLWIKKRVEMLAVLAGADSNDVVRVNAFRTLQWIKSAIEDEVNEKEKMLAMLSDRRIGRGFWDAATVMPLNSDAMAYFEKIHHLLEGAE